MLNIHNLSKRYGSKYALKNVNLNLDRSLVIGLVGPNGAGKTTLLKCITNLASGYDGHIEVLGNSRVGLVLDDLKAYRNRTLKFNLEYFRIVNGLSNYDLSLYILNKLSFDTGLINQKMQAFSYGMSQKVVTALSLMANPDIVLLDEPFRGLDTASIESFKGLLTELKTANKLVVFSSHNIKDVEEVCDKVIVINKGEILDIIDAKTDGALRNVVFNTSNNQAALSLIAEFNPTVVGENIVVVLKPEKWNEVVKIIANNDIEILSINNNSSLLKRVQSLLGGQS